jgi:prepilin-type N-terminal cleavage/methylation domain-containing protein
MIAYRGGPGRARGFTLVELMVVVAIVGVLATVAVFTYNKSIKKARAGEVAEVFGSFRLKQEQFQLENNGYLSTGADETAVWPSGSTPNDPGAVAPMPGPWRLLRMDLGKTALWCQYVIIAGPGGDITNFGASGALIFADLNDDCDGDTNPDATTPCSNWWYGVAECPFNGKTYWARSDRTDIVER